MAVVVTLLGAVRITVDGAPLTLPPLVRAVLARLALSPGRVISVELLIDALWGPQPPASARTRVQAVISAARRALGTHGRTGVIATRPPGYVMPPGEADIDLVRFDTSLARARQAMVDGDDDLALHELTAALAWWSAEALGGIECAFADPARTELEERRLRAVDEKVGLALRRRPPEDLVAELTGLVAANPLRERLRGYLMTALLRAGRRVEALENYRSYASFLDEQYGLVPGAELQELRDAALTDRACVAGNGMAAAVPLPDTRVVPAELPMNVHGFSGRSDALRRLDAIRAALGERPSALRIAIIEGAPGMGKTALAVHWAHQVRHRFPDGQLYVDLRGFDPSGAPLSPGRVLRGFLNALGVAPARIPADLEARSAQYRSLLADRRMLVLLDNARDAEQIRHLLPGAPGCLVVVTSRSRLTSLIAVEAAHPLPLGPLTDDEAKKLLAQRLGADRIAAEPDAVGAIVESCAGLPLALAIAAARVASHPTWSLADLAADLHYGRGRLDALTTGEPASDVRAAISWSYRLLGPVAARVFRLLGQHPRADLSVSDVAGLAGLSPDALGSALAELTGANLLGEPVAGRYTLHDLLRAYAVDLAVASSAPGRLHTPHRHAAYHHTDEPVVGVVAARA